MEEIVKFFAGQGVYGIIILMLIGVVIYLQKRIDGKDKEISGLQNQRIADANTYTTNYISIAKETVATSKEHLAALSLLQRSVDALATGLQKLLDNK